MEVPKNSNDNQPETTSNEIKFDILKIDSKIKKDSIYEEGESIFEFCQEYNPDNPDESEQKIDFPKYFAKIKTLNYEYLGILSKNLKKKITAITTSITAMNILVNGIKTKKKDTVYIFSKTKKEKILMP